MIGPVYAAAKGALLLQMKLDAVSNNLANASTIGFKRSTVIFHDPAEEASPGSSPEQPSRESTMEIPFSGYCIHYLNDFTAGPMENTGNSLDFAIEGDGFFCVETPAGVRYTRDGSFVIDQHGDLATKDGHLVQGATGKIAIEGNTVAVDTRGTLSVDGIETGALKIVRFPDPYSLKREGESLFSGEGAVAADDVRIHQGFLEHSNVNPIRTMTEMVEVLRGFESYQKIIQSLNEADTKMIQDVGRLS